MTTPVQSIGALPAKLTTNASSTATTMTSSATSKDQFLKLLVAQLQHQDPLSPQSGADFVAQLAQITQVEQSAQTNSMLGDLATIQSSAARTSMTSLMGKTVSVRSSTLAISAAGSPPMQIHLDGAASACKAVLTDARGNKVRTVDLGAKTAGDYDINWNQPGQPALPPGTYTVQVVATDTQKQVIASYAEIRGLVTGIKFQNGQTLLQVGSATVAPADIVAVQ